MKFGIDRLIAEPALRGRLPPGASHCSASASDTADLTHSLDHRPHAATSRSPPPSARNTACAATSRTTWSSRKTSAIRSMASRSSAYMAKCASRRTRCWRHATSSSSIWRIRVVDLYPHHDAALHARSGGAAWQSGVGAGSAESRWPAGRRSDVARRLAKLCRLRPVADAPWAYAGRAGFVVYQMLKLDVEYRVIAMQDWQPHRAGIRSAARRAHLDQSQPHAPNLWMARAYAGTVMVEGTTMSEGRGTTRPLEFLALPISMRQVIKEMHGLEPQWLRGCILRDCWFEPTFHKHVGKLCHGVQIHSEGPAYDHHVFKPGASRRSPSRRSAACIRTIRYGAILLTSTSTASSPSTSSTAGHCWANGWMMRGRCRGLGCLAVPDEPAWFSQRQALLRY